MTKPQPRVSVIVSTRNRPDDVVACVRGILATRDADFELVVVDQSEPSARQRATDAVGSDHRLRWIATGTRGLSVSRNIGLAETHAPVIAFTDDDCRVPPDWIAGIRAAFVDDPDVGLLFGAVVLTPEDRAKGYAAEFEPPEAREFHNTLPDPGSSWGVGANMAFRRQVFEEVGVFDAALGAGARFHAAEEIDLTLRSLARGFKAVHTNNVCVLHLGVREGAAAARLMRGYGIGLGAALTKHVRLRTPGAFGLLSGWLALHARRSLHNAIHGHKNPGFGLLAAVLWGCLQSFTMRIDRRRSVYVIA